MSKEPETRLRMLNSRQHFALGGLIALLLGQHAEPWGQKFCRRLLRQLMHSMLRLSDDQFEAVAPLAEPLSNTDTPADPSGFISVLPLEPDKRQAILKDLLLMIATGVGCLEDARVMGYDARARQLLCDLAHALEVPWSLVALHERAVAIEMKTIRRHVLNQVNQSADADPSDEPIVSAEREHKQSETNVWKRRIAIASVGVISGAVIGFTGGLAAPAVMGGIAAVGGGISGFGGAAAFIGASVTGAATLLSGAGGVAVISALFGATGAGLAARKMEKRLKDVTQFEFSQPDPNALTDEVLEVTASNENPALLVSVCVSGWLSNPPDWHDRHWFGTAAKQEVQQPHEKTLMNRTTDTVSGLVHQAYSWSSQSLAAGRTSAKATAKRVEEEHERQTGTRELEARVEWMVEAGFPEDKLRQVAVNKEGSGGNPSVEQMTDELMALGIDAEHGAQPLTDQGVESVSSEAKTQSARVEIAPSDSTRRWSHAQSATHLLVPRAHDGTAKASESTAGCGVLECLPHIEHHTLVWESKELRALGEALGNIAAAEAIGYLKGQVIKQTFFSALASSYALPALLMKACNLLDQPWAVAYERSRKAGRLLGETLIARHQGSRPVVLVGFGLGANLIFECLHYMLSKLDEGDESAAGIVQHVVLMGLPASTDPSRWERLKRVVAGRVVNCYRRDDLVLALVHRASNLEYDVAGLTPVMSASIENVDVSSVITSHHKYRHHVKDVLKLVGLEGTEREWRNAFDDANQEVIYGMKEVVESLNRS